MSINNAGYKNFDIHIIYMYIVCMNGKYVKSELKPVTLYMISELYETYHIEAQKKGKKASELIRDAMEYYAQQNFYKKKSMGELNLNRTVKLRTSSPEGKDFLSDYKSDFMDDQVEDLK